MAGIESNIPKMNHRAAFKDKDSDILLGPSLSPNSGTDLMQNCDLPPPLKVFTGSDHKTVISWMNKVFSTMGREQADHDDLYVCGGGGTGFEINDKLELLKALRLSQTRAREAEDKAANLVKERDCLAKSLLHDSLQLFAYRQLVRLLEFQVSKAQVQQEKKLCCSCGRSMEQKELLEEDDEGSESWIVAFTFCLGILGLVGCCYLF